MRGQVDLYRLHESAQGEGRRGVKTDGMSEREEEPDEEELRVDELLSMDKMKISQCDDIIESTTMPSNNICCTDIVEEEAGDSEEVTNVITEKGTTDLCDFQDL